MTVSEPMRLVPLMNYHQLGRCLEMGLHNWYDRSQRQIGLLQESFVGSVLRRNKRDAKFALRVLQEIWHELFTPQTKAWIQRALHIVERRKWRVNQEERGSPEYQTWRLNCLDRDNWACTDCGSKKELNVHHIKSFRDHPKLRIADDNGVTLCKPCHITEHQR